MPMGGPFSTPIDSWRRSGRPGRGRWECPEASPRRPVWGSSPDAPAGAGRSSRRHPRAKPPATLPSPTPRSSRTSPRPPPARRRCDGPTHRRGQNVRPINLVVEPVEAEGGLRLRLAIELPLKAADRIRSCKAHRQSPRPSPSAASTSEVRGLCSAGVTRPQRSYAPVRLPLEAAIPKMALRLAPRPKRVSPDDPSLSSDAPRPLPRRIEPVHLSMTSRPVLPAPSLWRVGIRIKTFEACSGFTHVTARKIAQLPKATFATRLRSSQSPGRTARQLPDPSTLIRVEPSSTRETRLQGAHRGFIRRKTAKKENLPRFEGEEPSAPRFHRGDLLSRAAPCPSQ